MSAIDHYMYGRVNIYNNVYHDDANFITIFVIHNALLTYFKTYDSNIHKYYIHSKK